MTVGKSLARSHEDRPPKVSASDRDPPRFIVQGNTTQVLYVFSASGLCTSLPVQQLPASQDPAAGAPLHSLCAMPEDEDIIALVALTPTEDAGSLLLATAAGLVKRIRVADLPGVSANAFSVINLAPKDSLLQVLPTDGAQEVLLASSGSRAIRFNENDVRHTGLAAGAVRGMRLLDGKERVIGAMLVRNGLYVWSITDDGLAQCALADEFPSQGRGGQGVRLTRLPQGSRGLVAATTGRLQDNLLVLTNRNKARYMRLGLAPRLRRGQAGSDYILTLRSRERVVAVVPYQREIMPARPTAPAPGP